MFVEEDYDTIFICNIRRNEDWDMRFSLCGAKWKRNGAEAQIVEAFDDLSFDKV